MPKMLDHPTPCANLDLSPPSAPSRARETTLHQPQLPVQGSSILLIVIVYLGTESASSSVNDNCARMQV